MEIFLSISTFVMIVCLFKMKSEMKLFFIWLFLYFIPSAMETYPYNTITSVTESKAMWCFGFFVNSLMLALVLFAIPLVIYLFLEFCLFVLRKFYGKPKEEGDLQNDRWIYR
ncbi:hypothetical protein [Helicobacter sp. MIT 05-5294]|uniref:hypothetical protein n=1 Tax=Helicobacter sp. MIT 05-5294 TaxID=1548150 RepID=UPI00051FB6C4|nr:hypothetical protein [Helicobacter sp. MIT 05-5294]TLD87803.1 hypothetical protein LS69_003130 [Helicobacter sp. MIT 05-5294]